MLDKLRDWLDSNPNGRRILIVCGAAALLMMVGVMIALNGEGGGGGTGGEDIPTVTIDPNSLQTTGGQPVQDPGLEPDRPPVGNPAGAPRRPRTIWINAADVGARAQPGLNSPEVRKLPQWEEAAHIQEDTENHWDQIRLKDGSEVWVQSKFVEWAKPSNLEKPVPAELAVMAFYQAVARQDYAQAYSYLADPWKAELSFDQFVDGYTKTASLRTEIGRVVELGEDRYQVDINMVADELGRDVPYLGSYIVSKDGDQWFMQSGRLLRQGPKDILVPDSDGVIDMRGQETGGAPPPPAAPGTPTLPPLPESAPEVQDSGTPSL